MMTLISVVIGMFFGMFIGYCYYITGDKKTGIMWRNVSLFMPVFFLLLILGCAVAGY